MPEVSYTESNCMARGEMASWTFSQCLLSTLFPFLNYDLSLLLHFLWK